MSAGLLRFDNFELDRGACELRRAGRTVRLERIPLDLLFLLAEHQGQLITREEILERLWGKDVFVDADSAINTAIRKIRQALKDDPEQPRFIQTVVGRGYRFIARIEAKRPEAAYTPVAVPALGPVNVEKPEVIVPLKSVRHEKVHRRLVLGLVVFALLVLLGLSYFLIPEKRIMLAVLPFENLSGDPEQEYFSDGFTEETITDLGQVSPGRMGVIARTSAMTYKYTSKPIRQIGKELGVDYVLEGSVRREEGRVRISAQLIRVKDQTHVWAQNYDSQLQDWLDVQAKLGQDIAQQVQVSLTPQRKVELAKKRPVDPEVYDRYLRGRYFWNKMTPSEYPKAIGYFQQATEKDPAYAPPYAGLADCYGTLPIATDAVPTESFSRAEVAARKAVQLDDSLAEGHVALVRINMWYEWNWPELEREAHHAFALNANSADAHLRYAHYLSNAGRHKEALEEVQRAQELDPFSPIIHALRGQITYYAGQYDLAVKQLRETVELFPDFWIGHIVLGKVYERKHMYSEALMEFDKAFDLSGGNTEALSLAGYTYAVSGSRSEALRILNELKERARHGYVPPYNIALIFAGLGDKTPALDWLEKGLEARDPHMVFLSVERKWDGIRSEPRFQDLLRRIGLPNGSFSRLPRGKKD
jgi:TolB-like protein/DNA-binding winged helix-turn-helix (wHTH) protein/Flp pilus assembly protein TadD